MSAVVLLEHDAALESLRRYYVETFGAKPLRPGSRYYYVRIPATAFQT